MGKQLEIADYFFTVSAAMYASQCGAAMLSF